MNYPEKEMNDVIASMVAMSPVFHRGNSSQSIRVQVLAVAFVRNAAALAFVRNALPLVALVGTMQP